MTLRAVSVGDADEVADAELIAYLEGVTGHQGKEALAAEVATMLRVPARFHRLVSGAAIGADSEAEREVARALIARGVAIEQNVFIGHYYFDIVLPEAGIIVEIDGYQFHSAESRESFVQDRWKANLATGAVTGCCATRAVVCGTIWSRWSSRSSRRRRGRPRSWSRSVFRCGSGTTCSPGGPRGGVGTRLTVMPTTISS